MNQRIFIGAAPENWQSEQILKLQNGISNNLDEESLFRLKMTSPSNFHMTIAFLGMASSKQIEQICLLTNKMDKPKFEIELNTLTLWRKPQVLAISGQNEDESLTQLYQQFQAVAETLSLHTNKHAFTPHITLCRKAKTCPSITVQPLQFSPREIHLYRSESTPAGVKYSIIKTWQLG